MARFRPLTTEVAAPTTAGAAITVGDANVVRAVNTAATAALITVVDAAGATVGTFTAMPGSENFIDKPKTYKVFAAAATVLLTSVSYPI